MVHLDFALVGPGRLGRRIARALVDGGSRCRAIRARRQPALQHSNMVPDCQIFDTWNAPEPWPEVQLVLVTVPDREIGRVARGLADQGLAPGTVVLHTSGLHTSKLLEPCREAGAHTGSWHPLQSFPAGDDPVDLQGVWCAAEGDPAAVDLAAGISRGLGMRPWDIPPGAKARYHAAAALASNLTHVLVVAAGRILGATGIPANPPASALEPLVTTSLRAALNAGGLEALTGPMARRDRETLERHLEVLPPELAEAYRQLARFVVSWNGSSIGGSIDPCDVDV
ncbi:MAG: DUF2520 domain-containing protein [Acidobacteria bacterium]|nr:DUF2520 domain-containing protein [Acidobacteriota bacterium]